MNLEQYVVKQGAFNSNAVREVLSLFDQDCTIPFIARYRKDKTNNMDELDLERIFQLKQKFLTLTQRKAHIIKSLEESGVQDKVLLQNIKDCFDLTNLEDLFLPYKKTRAKKSDLALASGLEPLAKMLMAQNNSDIESSAKKYICKEFTTADDVIDGALDIIALWFSENISNRNFLRNNFWNHGKMVSKVDKDAREDLKRKYSDYLDSTSSINRLASHRFLALKRAESEKVIKLSFKADRAFCIENLLKRVLKSNSSTAEFVKDGVGRAYSKSLLPSISKEIIKKAKEKADLTAINHFSSNLEQLLLSAPLGEKRVLALDPGFRSGCKLVCLDAQGKLLHNETIYPHTSREKGIMAAKKVKRLIEQYKIDVVAVGNGTAGKETFSFVKKQTIYSNTPVYLVDESGASIYSASAIARKEFPNFDITVRGAVSIGRRLMDPLAELIKIDPKSIGVGQYQHDVDQVALKESLNNTVVRCVNAVGININTASVHLLSYISGLSPKMAENIVQYREENGPFKTREDLLKVKGLGAKTFQQAAAFLRIKGGDNLLDNTWVHPEEYQEVTKLFRRLSIKDFRLERAQISTLKFEDLPKDISWGEYSFDAIKTALLKPGLDLRKEQSQGPMDNKLSSIADLELGMKVHGQVKNIVQFGAFVDIGIKENGLIHVSKLHNGFVDDIHQYIKLNQQVEATVVSIDIDQKRIGLSIID